MESEILFQICLEGFYVQFVIVYESLDAEKLLPTCLTEGISRGFVNVQPIRIHHVHHVTDISQSARATLWPVDQRGWLEVLSLPLFFTSTKLNTTILVVVCVPWEILAWKWAGGHIFQAFWVFYLLAVSKLPRICLFFVVERLKVRAKIVASCKSRTLFLVDRVYKSFVVLFAYNSLLFWFTSTSIYLLSF